ncbi:MAG: S9 family peptidase [Xanthomonadales bacterium]|nr:S9 family peptidase [Xanthomonadales bacterium]
MRNALLIAGLLAATSGAPCARSEPAAPTVERQRSGNVVSEGIPAIPDELRQRLARYQNTRGASFAGWLPDGGMLIGTRFGDTNQVHRVAAPGAAREQLTFEAEPVLAPAARPGERAGVLFSMDVGGSEFWQLHHLDLDSREQLRLSDGRSRNERALWSNAGDRIVYSTTRRNGRDSDLHVVGLDGISQPVLEAGGTWYAAAWSPDDSRLLVLRYVSIADSRPHLLDLADGRLTPLQAEDARVGYGAMAFAPDGKGWYYVADQDDDVRRLRWRSFDGDHRRALTADLHWDVEGLAVAADGRHLAYVANEDGISRLHVLALPGETPVDLPALPVGVVALGGFSPDGNRLAVTVNGARSPSDVYVVDLADGGISRWTRSEVGGLNADAFVAPTLVRYPTFDEIDGAARTIPAFYYRPPGDGPFPVVVNIHGGPEAQARPVFAPLFQFLVRELGVAVLVPNVRGSAGYGKAYLALDDGRLREDAVRDIGALLDWIATRQELDAGRVGVAGGSYGGYMVLASLVHFGERLRAGIDVVGISDFVTFLTNTQDYRRDLRRAEYGDERDPAMHAFLKEISPLTNAGRIDRPLLVAQGANDPRVPASEAEQIVARVRENGSPVWYLLFEDEGHGFAKKRNRDHYEAAAMLFWKRYLLPPADNQ